MTVAPEKKNRPCTKPLQRTAKICAHTHSRCRLSSVSNNTITSKNLVLHRRIAAVSCSRGGGRSCRILVIASIEIVSHLGVELFGCFLGWTAATSATAAGGLLATTSGSGTTLGSAVGGVLDVRCRLGLNLGLGDALAESLGLRNQVRGSNDNLNLFENQYSYSSTTRYNRQENIP